ncbi:uncharacterized protein TRUGW13939_07642 [Talaromyces rugulosus]|uniref:Uncharacterized protein n=1 Tax=Talaromyces rugulosus TaxID=121627 RepID=A0A7H8R2L9_TALRU|nr:uncharacterized protein TRUGW13939_07642 [Talaromyces rugulosus]QKX60497.1 hypothetical protein TRUGW13939_07642 [Talaromyces rugulosus]
MADKISSEQSKGKEAIVGVKADVKTLQHLSSSGKAAKDKREANQIERGMGAIGAAARNAIQGRGGQNQGNSDRPAQ